jgi:hypothetical protein
MKQTKYNTRKIAATNVAPYQSIRLIRENDEMPLHKSSKATEIKAMITQYTSTSNDTHKLKTLVKAANMLTEGH